MAGVCRNRAKFRSTFARGRVVEYRASQNTTPEAYSLVFYDIWNTSGPHAPSDWWKNVLFALNVILDDKIVIIALPMLPFFNQPQTRKCSFMQIYACNPDNISLEQVSS